MLTNSVVLLRDKKALLEQFSWEIFYHPPYSSDLAPSDYHLFSKVKASNNERTHEWGKQLMDSLAVPLFDEGYQKLVSRCYKCLNLGNECVEK